MVCLVTVEDYLARQKTLFCRRFLFEKKRLKLVGGLAHLVSWVMYILIWENTKKLKIIMKKEFRNWRSSDCTPFGLTCGRYLWQGRMYWIRIRILNLEQMVRYYGFYSNVSRGKRKKQDQDELISSILEPEGSSKEYRKNWARLIQKIYPVE